MQSFSSSAFSPAASRQTSVVLLRNAASGDHRLVTSISTRKTTEVLRINLRTGRIELENDRYAESSYENESEALDHLGGMGYEVLERGYALLGYVVAGAGAGVLLATRVREKAVLPGGHTVFVVTDSQWVLVPLQNEAADAATAAALAGLPPPKQDGDFWRALQQFTLNNAHYYCETADISRPFPSDHDPREPNPEFVWNAWLREPLVQLGLYDHCPALLQGAVECSTLQHPGGDGRFSICLISRRSRRHPGTRYIARGLNALAGPGNEIECELLTWTHPEQQQYASSSFTSSGGIRSGGGEGGEPLRWARVVWRRGTVPIWWGVQLQSLAQGLQAEVYVREERPYHGTASYFRNVQRQHVPRPALPQRGGSGGEGQQGAAAAAAAAGEGGGAGGSEGWTLVDGADGSSSSAAAATAAALAAAAGLEARDVALPATSSRGGGGGGASSSTSATASASFSAVGGIGQGEEQRSLCVPVTCINLLHANPKKASELMLSSHFQDAMRYVRRRLGSGTPIQVVNFDWHGNMGRLSEEKAVEGFWSLMEPFVKQTGFASGWMEAAVQGPEPHSHPPSSRSSRGSDTHPAPASSSAAAAAAAGAAAEEETAGAGAGAGASAAGAGAAPSTTWPPGWRMRWGAQQSGLLRFNCADSLDRTNAATCFAMLPVLQEQLRVLGLALECPAPATATAALLRSRQRSSAGDVTALAGGQGSGQVAAAATAGVEAEVAGPEAVLPEGWEVRQHEGRLLYIDHINKTTQWTPPSHQPTPRPGSAGGSRGGGGGGSGGTPLSARMMQSASDMLARLQRQTAPAPGSASPGPSASSSNSSGGGSSWGMPLMRLERRSSPPRVPPGHSSSGSDGSWVRRGSSSSLNGMSGGGGGDGGGGGSGNGGVHHAASAPDMSLAGRRHSDSSEAPSSASAEADRDPRRPWAFFDYDINDVREQLFREAVSDYVEMFRVHGDIHSFLYTGSPAMHSHVLNLVVQGGKGYGATSGVGKLQNLRVAVQRRWNNTISDTGRQQAMELFLGLRIHDSGELRGYFQGLALGYTPHDEATQAALGGVEDWEAVALPPAPTHSRSGSLAASPPPVPALAAAPASPGMSAALLGAGVPAVPAVAAQQQQQVAAAAAAGEGGGGWERAHAVPGVPAVEHDGILGVRQSLIDLEPFPALDSDAGPGLPTASSSLAHSSSGGGGGGSDSGSGPFAPAGAAAPVHAAQQQQQEVLLPAAPAVLQALDPLGALASPAPVQQQGQQQGEQRALESLISFGEMDAEDEGEGRQGEGAGAAATSAPGPAAAAEAAASTQLPAQLRDLLL